MTYKTPGLIIVVLQNGYRIIKREHKMSRKKVDDDFDKNSLNDKWMSNHPYLKELLLEIVDAYAIITGHRVTHDNSEPRWYISSYSPKGHNQGMYRCLRCHHLPMLKPAYENGNK